MTKEVFYKYLLEVKFYAIGEDKETCLLIPFNNTKKSIEDLKQTKENYLNAKEFKDVRVRVLKSYYKDEEVEL